MEDKVLGQNMFWESNFDKRFIALCCWKCTESDGITKPINYFYA